MATSAIFITDGDGNTLAVDATISESRQFSAKITHKPIEDGTSISDSKIIENAQFSIEGIISNTPIVQAQQQDVTVTPDYGFLKNASQFFNFISTENETIKVAQVNASTPVLNAYIFLQNLYSSFKTFSVQISGFDEIKNLLVKNFKVDFTTDIGDCLHFNLDIEQIQIVSSQTTTVPKNTAQSKVSDKKQTGTQQPKETPKAEVKTSWLSTIIGVGK